MKKIWQKSLASMVSAALCLTAFVGCLTVSAEKGSATITVENVSAKQGAEVVVPVKIKANTNHAVEAIDGVAVALFDLKFDTANLTVTKVSAPDNVAYCAEPRYANGETGEIYVDQNTSSIRILATFKDTTGKDYPLYFDLMTVNVTFKISADAKAGEYPVEILKAQACDAGTKTGTLGNYQYADDEDFIALTTVNGNVTVTPATTAPVLDENITCTLSAGLGDTAYMSFRFNTADLSTYNSYELVVTRNTKDSDYNFTPIVTTMRASDFTEYGSYVYAYYYGIELYSLTVPVSAVLNCKDAEGNVVAYSKTFESTLKDVLVANYNKSTNTKLKTTITDLLNAGSEAQKFFTSSRPSSDYAGLDLPNADFPQDYATAELGALATYNTPNNGSVTIAAGAAVGASPYLSFNMTGIPSDDIANYRLKISYYNPVKNQTVSETVNGVDMTASGSKYYAYFYNMAIYATNAEVTAELYDGVSVDPISSYSYCFDSFISLRQSHATLGPVVIALGKLGQSFRSLKGV